MYRILAQHKDFMVINKGPGLGMHDETDEAGLLHPGLVSRVKADTGLLLYPVHRLDKMTSGLVLLARTTEANRALSMAFAAREVSKQYLALSDRKPKKKQGWVKGTCRRDGRQLDAGAQPGQSGHQLVRLRVGTRGAAPLSHQASNRQDPPDPGCLEERWGADPGDERYGGTAADRGYLHAWRLAFTLAGEAFDFVCPPDEGTLFVLPELHAAIAGLAE